MAKAARRPTSSIATGPRTIRCAVYTRKSTEEGLDQAFNSLDAQREACEAYVLSQRHEGWVLIRDPYDDGGFSGGNLERPGLKRLMADVEAGKVDVIVVYKVDRLTRALSDFAKIVEVLDARGASFVSVTQAFNTTTSMGRLTLNVLLSFAQFEREVTGERIRDKIAQSKAKGMWMGGPVPLSYRVEDRLLVVDEDDARTVRHIFERYVALGSGRALIDELRSDGYRTKVRQQANRPALGGVPFGRGMLFNMLGNRIYLGEIVHKGVAVNGAHLPIILPELWDQVQHTLAAGQVKRKSGKRYRYYITPASELIEHGPAEARLPAGDIEAVVVERLRALLASSHQHRRILPTQLPAQTIASVIEIAADIADKLAGHYGRHTLVGALVQRVTLDDERVRITIARPALLGALGIEDNDSDEPVELTVPTVRIRHGKDVKLVMTNGDGTVARRDETLVTLLADAAAARAAVTAAPETSIKMLASISGQCSTRMSRLVRLSWLAPEIVRTISEGRHPPTLTPARLLAMELPACWTQQKTLLGI
ncbi:recombinase family protein [Sphingomonas montana]|uniref:recombinase family protein n=1 Tax=Sphingomonas montana TaxID=1843236 RepID=UPI0019D14C5C|nr:recombinase family protein [Sphingomonas montana]